MKLRNFGRRFFALASSLSLVLFVASCAPGNTIDFVYVTSNLDNPGQINVYIVDSLSGQLKQIADSPYPSGGRNPVYDVAAPNGLSLYVANHDDNTIVRFAIGTDAKLYPLQTVTTPGTEPVAMATNASGTALYVLDYYAPASPGQPSYTDLNPGPGALIVYPTDPTTGALGTPVSVGAANYFPVQCFPTNLTVTPDGNYVYVTNTNAVVTTTSPPVTGTVPVHPSTCPSYGTISAFSVQGSSGSSGQTVTGLTAIGTPLATGAGSEPTGITADPDDTSIYVTDAALNQLDTFSIQSGGALALASTIAAGAMPMGAAVVTPSSSSKFLYVTNYTSGSISIYSLSSGLPTFVSTSSAGSSGPLCVVGDPEVQRFLYTANYTGGTVGGAELDPSTGTLIQNFGAPFTTAGQPTCIAAVPYGRGKKNGL